MRRRDFLVTSGCAGLLAACGDDPPPPPPGPTVVALTATGTPGMNPAEDRTDRPVTLFLLRLREASAFDAADPFALAADPAAAVGPTLVGLDRIVVPPGGSGGKTLTFEPEAVLIGLVAVLRDPAGKIWRLTAPVTPHRVTAATVMLGPKGIELAMT